MLAADITRFMGNHYLEHMNKQSFISTVIGLTKQGRTIALSLLQCLPHGRLIQTRLRSILSSRLESSFVSSTGQSLSILQRDMSSSGRERDASSSVKMVRYSLSVRFKSKDQTTDVSVLLPEHTQKICPNFYTLLRHAGKAEDRADLVIIDVEDHTDAHVLQRVLEWYVGAISLTLPVS